MKYDELELMELFLSEGVSMTGNRGDGQFLYRINKSDFCLTVFIRTYEQQISIFLTFKEKDIFYVDLNDIIQLKKEDMYLKIFKEETEVAKICFGSMLSVSVEY